VDEWLTWARGAKLYPEVVAFIEDNSSQLEHKPSDGPYEPGIVYPSRRSWKRFSDALKASDKFSGGITESNAALSFMIASAFVGPIAAQKFRAFAMSYMRVVDPEQVLEKGQLDIVRNFTLPDIIEFCERIGKSEIYTQRNLKKLNLSHTIKFLDIIINESKAIEAFESFLEAVILSAKNDGFVISLGMNDVQTPLDFEQDVVLNTGSPHYVNFVQDAGMIDVNHLGRGIRNSEPYLRDGINVNFVEVHADSITVRTYERGVEEETLSCGTGVTASAIAAHFKQLINIEEVSVFTRGGELKVNFKKNGEGYKEISLIGEAHPVFQGVIEI
jgi:hypothetical protein